MPGPEHDPTNPFIRYRHQLDVHRRALDRGLDDRAYVDLVLQADAAVGSVDGRGFELTPLIELDLGPDGTVLAKVETGSVGGSHKARHLFGLLLALLIDEASTNGPSGQPADLAIASCGNAALGAAVVARGAGRRLRVFVPTTADPAVLSELDRLQAEVTRCPRRPGVTGDPCIAALDEAIANGATPFTVQGTRAPLAIDGGRTLGLELAEQLDHLELTPEAVFIQIGGGALATAVLDGLERGRPGRPLPRFHPVQAVTAHPYAACWVRTVAALLAEHGLPDPGHDRGRAQALHRSGPPPGLRHYLEARPDLMEPWPGTPESVASGILDDVTYDWVTVMMHQIRTGGWPILVEEDMFVEAARLASQVHPEPDETGAAGLAGLLTLRRAGAGPSGPAVVLLTGARR